ncbi:hypothetical protein BDW66DRAFT_57247 [Aspergillus desertorum]
MRFSKLSVAIALQLGLGCMTDSPRLISWTNIQPIPLDACLPPAAGCGEYDACIGTETCVTKTFTAPVSTVITTCVPTPTCIGVYGESHSLPLDRMHHMRSDPLMDEQAIVPRAQAQSVARDTVLPPNAEARIVTGPTARRIWDPVLWMRIAAMGTSALRVFVYVVSRVYVLGSCACAVTSLAC